MLGLMIVAAATASGPSWKFLEQRDRMTDAISETAIVLSGKIQVQIFCDVARPNGYSLLLVVDQYLSAIPPRVYRPGSYRFDSDPAVTVSFGYSGRNVVLLGGEEADTFVTRARTAKRLAIVVTDYEDHEYLREVPLGGASAAIAQLNSHCRK